MPAFLWAEFCGLQKQKETLNTTKMKDFYFCALAKYNCGMSGLGKLCLSVMSNNIVKVCGL